MNRKDQCSACYIIDSEYRIVTYNEVGKQTYPQLEIGEKCHKCLMNIDEPCDICPVLNGIQGPQTYKDPIRGIHETVDAVELYLRDGSIGHALVISTTGEREEVAKQLPTSEEELKNLLEQEYHDALTGGLTRKGFVREAEEILQSDTMNKTYAIAMLDIQKFKSINEIFGMHCGDLLLKEFYQRLKDYAAEPLLVGRLNSDHFVCLVDWDKLHVEDYQSLAEFHWNYEGRETLMHTLCGVYMIEDKTLPVSAMIEWAILAKNSLDLKSGRSFAIFDQRMRSEYIDRSEILAQFPKALENHEFVVYYQPVISLETGEVKGAEALVRWIHPEMGFVAPDQFVPVLEENGRITKLDEYVAKEVYRFLLSLKKKNMLDFGISVNLSWQDFYDQSMADDIVQLLQSKDLPRGFLNFEVTETSLTALEQNCSYLLEQFRKGGAKILLDDFGCGVSSLGMINDYTFDVIKLDRSFIRQIESNRKLKTIVQAMIWMGHEIGAKIVAEGVETKHELETLRSLGCDLVQGYYYAKPMPEEELLQYLAEQKLQSVQDSHQEESVDISGGKEYTEKIEAHRTRTVPKNPKEAYALFEKADRDRRIDFLTGLRTRLDLSDTFPKVEGSGTVKGMMMLDLDNFKQINDKYGHLAGDAFLCELGSRLNAYGKDHQVIFFRYGGEEILGIMLRQEDYGKMADEILGMVRSIVIPVEGKELSGLTASLGYTIQQNPLEKMVDYADQAMYVAKKRGKDCYFCFEEGLKTL